MDLAGKIKMVQKLFTTFRAIGRQYGRHLGFTFLIGRMTEVLAPVIYRAHWFYYKILRKSGFQSRSNLYHGYEIYKESINYGVRLWRTHITNLVVVVK
jgi:hypothetical protein